MDDERQDELERRQDVPPNVMSKKTLHQIDFSAHGPVVER